MWEEMATNKVMDVAEHYALADKCARVEEGRRLPREDTGIEVDPEDDDAATTPKKEGRKRNRKRKGKVLLDVEGSTIVVHPRRLRLRALTRRLPDFPCAKPWWLLTRPGPPGSNMARSTAPGAMTSESANKLSSLSRRKN